MTVSYADFDFVRKMVYKLSAITLDDSKDYLVEARLAPIVEREGLMSIAELVTTLRSGTPRLENDVVAAVATNETSFFRDVHPFDALRDIVIPGVLAANCGRLAMWSAAASTGQEAYSMAMLVREHFPSVPDVTILATDLSADVLDRARSGRFSHLEANRGLPARLLVKHFEQVGREWQVRPDVRNMVTFREFNLARRPFIGVAQMDVVFLRNVLIYFDTDTRVGVLGEVARVLRPGGHLFLGSSETTYGLDDSYERVGVGKTVCYRLTDTNRSGRVGV